MNEPTGSDTRTHMNRDAVFFFELAGPELVLFITDGLWRADCLAAGWGHNKMMCLPKAAEAGSPGTKWPSYEERRLIGRLESAATSS